MYENYEIYLGNDLGFTYGKNSTSFRLWAPIAEAVTLNLFFDGSKGDAYHRITMTRDAGGTWIARASGDLHGVYYTYTVRNHGVDRETVDPYAHAVGLNGIRSMVADHETLNPFGFAYDAGPTLSHPTDAVICEISIRDITGDPSCHAAHPGTFLGLTESGLTNDAGQPVGLDYLLDLGVTHVQIMPMYDFGSVDESRTDSDNYNWGYDPVNYNVPEGSYSTNPADGTVRIRELKTMIAALHRHGIGVIMDVVYNHTYTVEDNCFQRCVPNYFYRTREDGSFSNASACGNEIASERPMVRKYILDSVLYWIREYHIDGFRFDLMGVLDLETMQMIHDAADRIRPGILFYGEGWTGGDSTLSPQLRATKENLCCLRGIGAFSDTIRDTLKGTVFSAEALGYISGAPERADALCASIVGEIPHPQLYPRGMTHSPAWKDALNLSDTSDMFCLRSDFLPWPWVDSPEKVIHYMSCHDNRTLWDKLTSSCGAEPVENRLAMNRLGAAIIMTAQGIPFFASGEDFARSKPLPDGGFSDNSYHMPLSVNALDYRRLTTYHELHEYYKGLIEFRKNHALLRMHDATQVAQQLRFLPITDHVISYVLTGEEEKIFIAYNPNPYSVTLPLPDAGAWKVCIQGKSAGNEVLNRILGSVDVEARSCLVAVS